MLMSLARRPPVLSPARRCAVPNLDDDRYNPELVEVNVAWGKSRTLATAQVGLTSPRYSRDGKLLAYLASVGATGIALSVQVATVICRSTS